MKACPICTAQRIALGWTIKVVQAQRFAIANGAQMTPLEVTHHIARLNARHANN
jgi:hypothetical protein